MKKIYNVYVMNELFFDEQCLFTQYRNIQILGSKIINSNDLSVSGNHPAFIKNYSKDNISFLNIENYFAGTCRQGNIQVMIISLSDLNA